MDFCDDKCVAKGMKPDTEAIFISSRIRLARNIAGEFFGERNSASGRREILQMCMGAIGGLKKFSSGSFLNLAELGKNDRDILVERNMISRELADASDARGVYLSADSSASVMINEEDHLRIQVLERGLCLESLWKKIDSIDNQIEKKLPYAYSDRYGYLTACPSNTGTGLRASVMMHLIGLSLSEQMDAVIRGLTHMGIVARGPRGEGSAPIGGMYQISNQRTLGFSEYEMIGQITEICAKLGEFEWNARLKLLEDRPEFVCDKIARSWAVLESCRMISGSEAYEHLCMLRFAADLGLMPTKNKIVIDSMIMETKPANLMRDFGHVEMDSDERDILRAKVLKSGLKSLRKPKICGSGGSRGSRKAR